MLHYSVMESDSGGSVPVDPNSDPGRAKKRTPKNKHKIYILEAGCFTFGGLWASLGALKSLLMA